MILAEKITYLRKQKEWSQEELADQLEISRQSVSKWESGASIPELDKIIGMSQIFGVSTDFLLKDEYDTGVIIKGGQEKQGMSEEFVSAEETAHGEGRTFSIDDANIYLETVKKTAGPVALGVLLCIWSPISLLVMGGWAEFGPVAITEDMAAGLGIAVLLVMVAIAVVLFIVNGMKTEPYEYLEREKIHLLYGVRGVVEKKKEAYTPRYRRTLALGVTLCILSVLPILFAMCLNVPEIWDVYCVCQMLAVVSVGVFLLVWVSSVWESYQKLLEEGDYTPEKKRNRKKVGPLAGAYWCLVVAVYLVISFHNNSWHSTWLIWPVAALIFVVLLGIFRAVTQSRDRNRG